MTLLYFAWVREAIGTGEETVALPEDVATVDQLLAWLRTRGDGYTQALAEPERIRVAVNQDYVGPDAAVTDADEVAIFPPVTGG